MSVADVAELPWIGVPEDFPFARAMRRIEHECGHPLEVVARFPDLRVIEGLIAGGHGIGLVSRYTANRQALRLLPLDDVAPARDIVALTRPERAAQPAVALVLAALAQAGEAVANQPSAPISPTIR